MENTVSEQVERYIKFKARQIKKAARKGNDPKARRHARELSQFLSFGSDEMPVDEILEEVVEGESQPMRDKLKRLKL